MSNQLNRKHQRRTQTRKDPPVLIVRPHRDDSMTCQQTSAYVTRAMLRGIAECQPLPSKVAELARNYSIHDLLANHPRKTHIFFMDDDSPPKHPFAIEKLLSHRKPVVCGVTPIWRYGKSLETFDLLWSPIVKNKAGKLDNIGVDELPKKMFKAHRTGGTCMLIERKVLEKLEPPYQVTTFNETVTDVKLSEDMYFADKIRDAGFEIWVDPEVVCSHLHRLDILDVFAVYNTAMRKINDG